MYRLPVYYAKEKEELAQEKASRLGHQIVWSEYSEVLKENTNPKIQTERVATLKIRCLEHSDDTTDSIETTYHNYLRARNGLKCCGKSSVSKQLTNRVFSPETREKMSSAMKKIQATRPRAKDHRDSIHYDQWRQESQELGQYKCQMTGVRPKNLVVHHLFSMKTFQSIMYNSRNSVTLDSKIHSIFHKIYGYKKPVTIDCFIIFLEDLINNASFRERIYSLAEPRSLTKRSNKKEIQISNQLFERSDDGSETRVYDPKWIMELHECMVERRIDLQSLLNSDEQATVLEVQKRVSKMNDKLRTQI